MPANPCPCGTEPKAGMETIQYITQAILDAAQAVAPINIVTLLNPLYGRAFNLEELCAEPPPRPPTSLAEWWENPVSVLDSVLAAALRISWNNWCQCSDCPPVTGCQTGSAISLDVGDAYCPVSAQVPEPDPCAPCQVWYYVLPAGATYYAERSDGNCYGPFNGIEVRWPCPDFAPPGYVTVANADGSGAQNWLTSLYGTTVTLWTGGSGGTAPSWVWQDDGTTVGDPPAAPVCDDTTVCDAVDYIRERVNVLVESMAYVFQALGIATENVTVELPHGSGPLNLTPAQALELLGQQLLPILPDQLTNPETTPIDTSGTFDVSAATVVAIELTTIPAWMGYRGTTARVQHTRTNDPSAGWLLILSEHGVLEYHDIKYPDGQTIVLPPLAETILFQLQPGVEIAVTTYDRAVG